MARPKTQAKPKQATSAAKPAKKKTTAAIEAPTNSHPKPVESVGTSVSQARKVKPPKYSSFSLQKCIKPTGPKLPNAFTLFRRSLAVLRKNWKTFSIVLLWYTAIEFLLVQGLSSGSDVNNVKSAFTGILTGGFGHIAAGAASFLYLLSFSGNSAGSTAGSYQLVWMLIASLAFIWVLRQVYIGHTVRARDAFYKGMYAFVPFTLVLMVIALQCLPMIGASAVFSNVMTNGLTSSFTEVLAWSGLFFLFTLLSLYMVSSSIFAMYIVSLPDITPMKALRSARQLVLGRRWSIMRKLIFLPILLTILGAIIMIPLIIGVPAAAPWVLYLLVIFCMPIVHSYLYALYRTLL